MPICKLYKRSTWESVRHATEHSRVITKLLWLRRYRVLCWPRDLKAPRRTTHQTHQRHQHRASGCSYQNRFDWFFADELRRFIGGLQRTVAQLVRGVARLLGDNPDYALNGSPVACALTPHPQLSNILRCNNRYLRFLEVRTTCGA